MSKFIQTCLAVLLCAFVVGCSTTKPPLRPDVQSYLDQASRLFSEYQYREAKQILYPLACEGVPKAQYAIGYMYYYGYGVQQDTDVGYFWIKRAADQGYAPALRAMGLIERNKTVVQKQTEKNIDTRAGSL